MELELLIHCSFNMYICVCVKVAQSCPTLCGPMNHTVHGVRVCVCVLYICICVCIYIIYMYTCIYIFGDMVFDLNDLEKSQTV